MLKHLIRRVNEPLCWWRRLRHSISSRNFLILHYLTYIRVFVYIYIYRSKFPPPKKERAYCNLIVLIRLIVFEEYFHLKKGEKEYVYLCSYIEHVKSWANPVMVRQNRAWTRVSKQPDILVRTDRKVR